MKRNIPILLYHHVAPNREITPEGFASQMRQLLDDGYQSLTMSEVLASVRGERSFNRPVFALTFDDGYLDNWVYAFPLLKRLKIKATIYVVTQYIEDHSTLRRDVKPIDRGKPERNAGDFFSWQEARAMIESGWVEIGSHTQSHRDFIRKQPYPDLDAELRGSKTIIEERLGRPCPHLAWPWGDFETDWLPQVRQAGYQSAVTTLGGANTQGSNPLMLKRIKVSREGSAWLTRRLRWQDQAWSAASHGFLYGWDRRIKSWLQRESPYAHG